MNIAPEKTLPPLPPFRPRQRRADMPPIARWNPRAAHFRALRASLPPLTSRAACARHRLGRKTADRYRALARRLDRVQKELSEQNTRTIDTLHTLALPLATLTHFIHDAVHDAERASSLCRTLRAAIAAHSIPRRSALPFDIASARLVAPNASPRPLVEPGGFFGE
ncbi:hypothetical protein C8R46DRAFT_1069293 [Mycena filopes]|nr:hypothetical protein C8R46DRAFT_1069293 [Mycena filopes]